MRSYNKLILFFLPLVPLSGQLCTLVNQTNCSTTGISAGPPTLKAYVTQAAGMFPQVTAFAASLPQPKTILSAQIIAGADTFITSDPRTCPNTGTCNFNNLTVAEGIADTLLKPLPNGMGLKSIDINIWMGPIFESTQYTAVCATTGTCFTPTGSLVGWYQHSLANFYDPLFAYIASTYPGTLIRLAPGFTADVIVLCGITEGAPTLSQIENCAGPVEAAMAARWHVDYMTPSHEPCGELATILGTSPACAVTVAQWNALMAYLIPKIKANSTYAGIKAGPGLTPTEDNGPPYSCPNSGNYVCACYTTTAAIVDYCGLDVYPQDGAAGTYFSGVLGLVATEVAGIEAASCASANCEAWANESSFLRYGPTSGGGEGATYYGCGYVEWLQDGLSIAWIQDVTGKWVPANGMKGWSVFAMAPFMYITTDPLNNRCDNSDGYMPLAMQAAGSITQYGLAYGRAAAGQSATVQGTAKIQNGKIQ